MNASARARRGEAGYEACDDGNTVEDACKSDCSINRCSDGVVGPGEVAMTAMKILPMLAMTAGPRGVVMGWNRPTSSATMVIALTTMPVSVTALPPAVAMEFFAGI